MSSPAVGRPLASEYAPDFGRYINLIANPDPIAVLEDQLSSTRRLLGGISEERGGHRYAPEKWSIKEVVGHVIDAERVFAYRALRFARNDTTELPGFDQDVFAASTNFTNLPLTDIVREYEAVRVATLFLFKHLPADAWDRRGVANKNEMTVRALAFSIAGHEAHHVGILNRFYL